jgi:hypothetical protein
MNKITKKINLIISVLIIIILCNQFIFSRYYDPDTGRFTTADSVTPGGGANSQGLNRYSYCSNNPVKYVDPSGHAEFISDMIASTKEIIMSKIQSLKDQFNPSKSLDFMLIKGDKEYLKQLETRSDSIFNNSFMNNLTWAYSDTKKDINVLTGDMENRPGWYVPIICALALDAYMYKGIPHLTGEKLKERIAKTPHEFANRKLVVDDPNTGIFYKLREGTNGLEVEFTTTRSEMEQLAKSFEINNNSIYAVTRESQELYINKIANEMKGIFPDNVIEAKKQSYRDKFQKHAPDWAKKLDNTSK